MVAALAVALSFAPSAPAAGRCGEAPARPWCDASLAPDARALLLLAELTQQEKFSLMAGDDATGVFLAFRDPRAHVGTSLGVERLGIPTLFFTDGPLGVRQGMGTGMPAAIGLAATFDPTVAERYGAVVGNEAKLKGNDVVHAPIVNLMRTPLAGRTFEGYGEDPLLTARIGVGWTKGAQAEGVVANVKHFAANNQEADRFVTNAQVDERTLREMYLPQFEANVREGRAGSVMCAYNRVNGTPACENGFLLEDVLRGEWGFEGFVLTDYGFAQKSTAGSANNGLELEMPQAFFYSESNLQAAVTSGRVPSETIDLHVRRILRTMFAFGVFDREAYLNDDAQIDKLGHADVTREIEEAAITLLKNDGVLPLRDGSVRSIAIVGSDADGYKRGGGSGQVEPFVFTSPRAGITKRAGEGVEIRYDPGDDPARAAATARGADVALVFASDNQTEFVDKPCLSLQCGNPPRGDQDGLIDAVAAANPNTVVVLETGGPVLTPWRDRVRAVVEAWYPGAEGGTALARVLFGDVDPGGRLPATFPRREEDKPLDGNPRQFPGVAENAEYSEGVFVGYRHYDERSLEPAFPFGHGLSYTSFGYRDLRIEPSATGAVVSAVVENTGSRAGVETPQLYIGLPAPRADVPQPPRALKGFAKVALEPGQSRRVRFVLDERALSYYDVQAKGWRVAPGCYGVAVGRSSRDLPLAGVLRRGAGTCARAPGGGRPPSGGDVPGRGCNGRAFSLRLPEPRGRERLVSARVTVNGRRAPVRRRGGRLVARIDFRSVGTARPRVRIVARTSRGRTIRRTRTYRRCSVPCRRSATVRLRDLAGRERLVSARVTLNGRRVKASISRRGLRARIDLRRVPAGPAKVRIVARTSAGRAVRATRTFRACGRRRTRV